MARKRPKIAELMREHGEQWPKDMGRHRGQYEDAVDPVFAAYQIPRARTDRWKLLAVALAYEYERDLLEPRLKSKGGHPRRAPSDAEKQNEMYREFGRYVARQKHSRRAAAANFLKNPDRLAECQKLKIGKPKTLVNGLIEVEKVDQERQSRDLLLRFGRNRAAGLLSIAKVSP